LVQTAGPRPNFRPQEQAAMGNTWDRETKIKAENWPCDNSVKH
jgi:hypothetical protein